MLSSLFNENIMEQECSGIKEMVGVLSVISLFTAKLVTMVNIL